MDEKSFESSVYLLHCVCVCLFNEKWCDSKQTVACSLHLFSFCLNNFTILFVGLSATITVRFRSMEKMMREYNGVVILLFFSSLNKHNSGVYVMAFVMGS